MLVLKLGSAHAQTQPVFLVQIFLQTLELLRSYLAWPLRIIYNCVPCGQSVTSYLSQMSCQSYNLINLTANNFSIVQGCDTQSLGGRNSAKLVTNFHSLADLSGFEMIYNFHLQVQVVLGREDSQLRQKQLDQVRARGKLGKILIGRTDENI